MDEGEENFGNDEPHDEPPNEPDYSEEMAKDAWIEEQNDKAEYEAQQSANAEAEAMAQQEQERAKEEYQELHKDCISKQKINEIIDKVIPPDENCAANMILNATLKKEFGTK